jgi:hypothetical protein
VDDRHDEHGEDERPQGVDDGDDAQHRISPMMALAIF